MGKRKTNRRWGRCEGEETGEQAFQEWTKGGRGGRPRALVLSKKQSKKRKKTPASLERGQYQQVRTAPTRILKADHYVSDSLTPFNSTLEPLHLAS